jgi:Tat protein secretion system quality control protein TatD with DNase activity
MNPNSQISRSIMHIPLEQILIESDSPYMPLSDREISAPDDCLIYAQKVVELTQKSPDEIITKANLNWTNLFG